MLMDAAGRLRTLTSICLEMCKQYGSERVRPMNYMVAFERPNMLVDS